MEMTTRAPAARTAEVAAQNHQGGRPESAHSIDIRALRSARQWTQEEAAAHFAVEARRLGFDIGLSARTVRRFESTNPPQPAPVYVRVLRAMARHNPPEDARMGATSTLLISDTVGWWLIVRHHDGTWHLPGGTVEAGEAPNAAAIRETAEKTGVLVTGAAPAVVEWSAQDGARGRMAFMFAATVPATAPPIRIDRDELVAAEWAPRDRAFQLLDAAAVRRITAALDHAPATAYLEAR